MIGPSYPTLLNRKAKMIGKLNRRDLIIVAVSYLTMSILKLSGVVGLVLICVSLFISKFIENKAPKGFIELLRSPRQLPWSYKLRGHNERN